MFGRKTQTLHHGVLSALRDLIVHSELPPGIRLTEAVLCEHLKVSRTPLREALKVLSHEGLVEILPNRGARVVQLAKGFALDIPSSGSMSQRGSPLYVPGI